MTTSIKNFPDYKDAMKTSRTVSLTDGLLTLVSDSAKEEKVSVNEWIDAAIREKLERKK